MLFHTRPNLWGRYSTTRSGTLTQLIIQNRSIDDEPDRSIGEAKVLRNA